jgi:uncharacterized protein (TIGR03067 family)
MRITLVLLTVLAIGADAKPQRPPDKELNELQGEWTGVSFEANGKLVSTAKAGWNVTVKGEQVAVHFGVVPFDGRLVVGSVGDQKTLDIVETKSGKNPVRMEITGIYKLERDRLTICYRFGTKRPPSEFRTNGPSDTMIQVFARTK